MSDWNLDPLILAALASYAAVYVWRFRGARREGGSRGASALHAVAFIGAMLALVAALVSPIDHLGDDLFLMHMTQHVLIGDIAPVLLLLALSRVMLRPATRRLMGIERSLGPLAHPGAFLLLWLALVYLWHIPALYDAALNEPVVHFLEHASFFLAGLAVWWPLIQPVPMRHRLTGLKTFGYIGTAKLGLGALGIFLAWSSTAIYPHYQGDWGLTPVQDQNVGGAIMMVEQSLVLVIAFVVLFIRMLNQSEEDERRRERLEDAALAP